MEPVMIDPQDSEGRPRVRQFVALLIIGSAVAHSLGVTLRMPSQLEANDISRWCTVWSLVERGTYQIDDCPWQNKTQDKVYKVSPFDRGKTDAPKHFYSSKPPLLPTIVAGILYPIRKLTGVPLDANVLQQRVERTYRKYDPNDPTKYEAVPETPDPVKWPVYVFYFKPMVVVLNILPYLGFLILFARLLDRLVTNDWAWFAGLTAAAWGTPLTIFNTTLKEVKIYGELHRFVPALAYMRGFRVGEIEVHHRARRFGVSKYGVTRFLKGLLDLLTVRFLTHYGQRPLHLMGTIGLAALGVGGLGLALLIIAGLMGWSGGWLIGPAVLTTVLLIIGVQSMGLGLLGQLITSYMLDETTTFSIAATIGEWSPS
jgi:hypothetical protein